MTKTQDSHGTPCRPRYFRMRATAGAPHSWMIYLPARLLAVAQLCGVQPAASGHGGRQKRFLRLWNGQAIYDGNGE